MGDLTQEVRARLQPLIPRQKSLTTMEASPHRLEAYHLVAGLTNTRGGLRSRPMPTPAVIPRSPFVPSTAQPPYSHVENSMQAELDQLECTALRAMVDVESFGSSDLGGDEPPLHLLHPPRTMTTRIPRTQLAIRRRKRGRPSATKDAGLRRTGLLPTPRLWRTCWSSQGRS